MLSFFKGYHIFLIETVGQIRHNQGGNQRPHRPDIDNVRMCHLCARYTVLWRRRRHSLTYEPELRLQQLHRVTANTADEPENALYN